jgi:peptidoglycan/xylan/chitin deacetylase (PgdA/CDA1 family)
MERFVDSSTWHALGIASVAVGAGVLSAGGLLAYSVFMPRCQFWAPVIRSIPQRDAIALTFDDGPDERFTPQILDILAQHNAKATFFVIGRFARKSPALIRRIVDEGHVLGNHSLDHEHFGVNRNLAYWRTQIGETQKIVADISGQQPYLFRPPMGFKTWHIANAAKEIGLPVVGWSVRGLDTKIHDSGQLARRVLAKVAGYDIILLHDGVEPGRPSPASQQNTVDALPAILNGFAEKEHRPLTLVDALIPETVA